MQFLKDELEQLKEIRYKEFKATTASIARVWKQINCQHEWEDQSYQIGAAKVKRLVCPKCELQIYDETYDTDCDALIADWETKHSFKFTNITRSVCGEV